MLNENYTEIYKKIGELIYPLINENIQQYFLEFEYVNEFTFSKIYEIDNRKRKKLLNIMETHRVDYYYEDNELMNIIAYCRELRELMTSKKGKWNKFIYSIDKEKIIRVDFEYPEIE